MATRSSSTNPDKNEMIRTVAIKYDQKDLSEEDESKLREALCLPDKSVELSKSVTIAKLYDYLQRSAHPDAAQYSEINFVLSHARNWVNLNGHDKDDCTLLHHAVLLSSCEWVQSLLIHDANPEIKSKGSTVWEFVNNLENFKIHRSLHNILVSYRLAAKRSEDVFYIVSDSDSRSSRAVNIKLTMREMWTSEIFDIPVPLFKSLLIFIPHDNASAPFMFTRALARFLMEEYHEVQRMIDWRKQRKLDLEEMIDYLIEVFEDSIKSPAIAASNPLLNYRDPMYEFRPEREEDATRGTVFDTTVVVFPYLAIDKVEAWTNRRAQHKEGGLCTTSTDLDRLRIYCEHTLDEAYYPGLREDQLEQRNASQVIQRQHIKYQAMRKQSGDKIGDEKSGGPILLVPQLWIWEMNNVMVSTYPLNTGQMPCADVYDYGCTLGLEEKANYQMARAILEHVEAFGRPYTTSNLNAPVWGRSSPPPPPKRLIFLSTLDYFELEVLDSVSSVQQYIKSRSTYGIDLDSERTFIESIADIRNELDIIDTILTQQEEIIEKMLLDRSSRAKTEREKLWTVPEADKFRFSTIPEQERNTERLLDCIGSSQKHIKRYKARIKKINRDADRVTKTIDDMLNLSRTEASIKETQNSVIVGWAAIAFAIVTVIFTPLSFMASLMALPIGQFMDHQYNYEEGRAYKSGYIASIFVGAEIASLVVTGAILGVVYWFSPMNRSRRMEPAPTRNFSTQADNMLRGARRGTPNGASSNEKAKSTGWAKGGFRDSLTRSFRRRRVDGETGDQERGVRGV